MRTSFGGIRKYGSVIGKIMMALVLAVLISGISAVWAQPRGDYRHDNRDRYERRDRDRYKHGRRVYRHYVQPHRVYAPPAVFYAPPPPPWGIEIFFPPIIIR
jgi:hypothetical protein